MFFFFLLNQVSCLCDLHFVLCVLVDSFIPDEPSDVYCSTSVTPTLERMCLVWDICFGGGRVGQISCKTGKPCMGSVSCHTYPGYSFACVGGVSFACFTLAREEIGEKEAD